MAVIRTELTFWITKIAFICTLFASLEAIKLNIITIIVGNNPFFGYQAVAPMYDVAFEDAKAAYPHLFTNVSRYTAYKPGTYSCSDASALMPMVASSQVWDFIDKNKDADLTVLFSSGCTVEILGLGDYAREWNVPIFSSIASDSTMANKARYPTVITLAAPDRGTIATAVKLLLDKFSWSILTILSDDLTQYPQIGFYTLACANIRKKLDLYVGSYTTTMLKFDSNTFPDYRRLLERTRHLGRVALMCTIPQVVRDIMVAAQKLNMTNGEYIFLSAQLTTGPRLGYLSWQHNDIDDQVAFEAFQSVIPLTNPDPRWQDIPTLLDSYVNTSKLHYNYTFAPDEIVNPDADDFYQSDNYKIVFLLQQRNDLATCGYEAFSIFSKVLNETVTKGKLLNGRQFASKFWNRTFKSTRTIYVNNNGLRENDVQFFRFNVSSGQFEEIWRFYAVSGEFVTISNLSYTWKGNSGPPLDHPLCGFNNELCFEQKSSTAVIAGIVSCLAVVAIIFGLGAIYLKHLHKDDNNNLWWWLDSATATLAESPPEDHIILGQIAAQAGAVAFRPDLLKPNRRIWNGSPVWAESFSPGLSMEQLLSNKSVCATLAIIRRLHHENVGAFVGIMTANNETSILFEFGQRGSLRMLLNDESFAFDVDLQSSVTWDILNALEYIQNSYLHVHGSVSSVTVMVDKRFCMRICSYSTSRLLLAILKRNTAHQNDIINFWKAPEVLANEKAVPTRESDVYSVGIVVTEIFTRKSPLNIFSEKESTIKAALYQLQEQSEPRIDWSLISTLSFCGAIQSCLALDIHARPTLKQFMNKLVGKIPKQNIISSVLSRLQRYSENLEIRVSERTVELLEEGKKVDALLREMIPADFVLKLRNKQPVAAESFDCVTVLFSDFPKFAAICAGTTPLHVIQLLNYIYSIFDHILDAFDVYKVETINDSYMVASGLPVRNGNRHVSEIAQLSLVMLVTAGRMHPPIELEVPLQLRVGFHSGHCAAGIIGNLKPRYCLFGDTINTASRMESHGAVSKIHLSVTSKILLDVHGSFQTESRGQSFIKGKGNMETFWLLGKGPKAINVLLPS